MRYGRPRRHCGRRGGRGASTSRRCHGELLLGGRLAAAIWGGRSDRREVHTDTFGASRGAPIPAGTSESILADASLDYLGRLDNQVRVRGFRTSWGSRSALRRHPWSRRRGPSRGRTPPLGIHLARRGACPGRSPTAPRSSRLRTRRPASMIPTAWAFLARSHDTTAGGPRALSRLRRTGRTASGGEAFVRPGPGRGDPAGVFAEVMASARELRDDLFALGGHSLLATRVPLGCRCCVTCRSEPLTTRPTSMGGARVGSWAGGAPMGPPSVPARTGHARSPEHRRGSGSFLLGPRLGGYNLPSSSAQRASHAVALEAR